MGVRVVEGGVVLPASAGMILRVIRVDVWVACAPRIRGDDPLHALASKDKGPCSSHPRG